MPTISFRSAAYSEHLSDTPAVLVKITHPSLTSPVYLSSDASQRISTDPLVYGTISNGFTYLFVLMSVNIPDDSRDTPPRTQLVLENVEADIVAVVRSMNSLAAVELSLIMAARPNVIEAHYSGLNIVKATYDAEKVTLDISREPFTHEPWPSDRMSRSRFPALWHG